MSVAGKSKDDWVAATFTDFGEKIRKDLLRHHFSIQSALRAYKELKKIYGPNSHSNTAKPCRIWQETRSGEILNDSDNDC